MGPGLSECDRAALRWEETGLGATEKASTAIVGFADGGRGREPRNAEAGKGQGTDGLLEPPQRNSPADVWS